MVNRKERVLAAVRGGKVDQVPAGFWLHFPQHQHQGQASIQAHVDFFRQTNTDIVKIMNEHLVPCTSPIRKASDWATVRPLSMSDPGVIDQLDIIKRVTDEFGDEAVAITTIHGTIASAYHARGGGDGYETNRYMLAAHLRENPRVVGDAFRIIAEGMAEFTQACLQAGAQGIYYSALGGEYSLFTDEEFALYVKPHDLAIFAAAAQREAFNVLHICKDGVNLNRYADYHPDVVSWALHDNAMSIADARKLFPNSAILGGLDDRSGVLVEGSEREIEQAVFAVLDEAGNERFILGADCTLPTDISLARIRTAVDAVGKYASR